MTNPSRWSNTLAHTRVQRGATHRRQLLQLGWTDAMIATAVATGLLERDHVGTYVVSGSPNSERPRVATGLFAAGQDAALTSITAARLYGLHGLPRDERIHVLVPHDRLVRRSDARLVVRRSRIPDPSAGPVEGLVATSPTRTLIELGRDLSVAELTEVLAHALHLGVVTAPALAIEVERCARTRGMPTVRAALARLAPDDARARARRERSVARLLVSQGLPRPRQGYTVSFDGGGRAELDLAYPSVLVGIEVDGDRWHRSPNQKRYDEVRQNRLTGAGWAVLRFGDEQIDRSPRSVVRTVRAVLERRGHGSLRP